MRLDLLNPYSEQETPSDKLSVLDIKAQDERGRWFNVEMQMHLGRALAPRLLYYWARLYGAQLVEGDEYDQLRQTISICFLNQTMFHQREAYHSVFGLWERPRQLCLAEHLEIHLLEIPKFHRAVEALREPLDFWLYFLQNGKELDADALPSRLARPEIQQAMEVLKMFSQSELERDRYENRLKGWRDYRALVRAREEAIQERDEVTRERDEVTRKWDEAARERDEVTRKWDEAARKRDEVTRERDEVTRKWDDATRERDQAIERRDVALEVNRRNLSRRIQLCQRLLGQAQTPCDQLMARSLDDLQSLADQLEQQLPDP